MEIGHPPVTVNVSEKARTDGDTVSRRPIRAADASPCRGRFGQFQQHRQFIGGQRSALVPPIRCRVEARQPGQCVGRHTSVAPCPAREALDGSHGVIACPQRKPFILFRSIGGVLRFGGFPQFRDRALHTGRGQVGQRFGFHARQQTIHRAADVGDMLGLVALGGQVRPPVGQVRRDGPAGLPRHRFGSHVNDALTPQRRVGGPLAQQSQRRRPVGGAGRFLPALAAVVIP
ncbi:MAG: hypothetical protein ACYC26_14315 [Phycisphaerales bacterium]